MKPVGKFGLPVSRADINAAKTDGIELASCALQAHNSIINDSSRHRTSNSMDSARHRDIAFSRDYSSLISNEIETSLKVTSAYLKLIQYVFHELLKKKACSSYSSV